MEIVGMRNGFRSLFEQQGWPIFCLFAKQNNLFAVHNVVTTDLWPNCGFRTELDVLLFNATCMPILNVEIDAKKSEARMRNRDDKIIKIIPHILRVQNSITFSEYALLNKLTTKLREINREELELKVKHTWKFNKDPDHHMDEYFR